MQTLSSDSDKAAPNARLLDLTRLVSRVGRGVLTGVDRVEMAYLHALLQDSIPLFALVRLSGGFALLDQKGCEVLLGKMTGKTNWGRPDFESLLRVKQRSSQKMVQSDCRRLAVSKSRTVRGLLGKNPLVFSYLNVGHSNIFEDVFCAIKESGSTLSVLVHDMIPLDFPDFQRDGSVPKFAEKMRVVSKFSDLVIYNSFQSQRDGLRHFGDMGRIPESTVAHLGLAKPNSVNGPVHSKIATKRPFFVSVGTIEPRKNHELLLGIWAKYFAGPDAPQLVIIGARGWNNSNVFRQLDAKPRNVVELNQISDQKLAQLTRLSAGLLFPSLCEGFGLPPAEAVLQQTPVICGDLPVYREFLGNIPVYVDTDDRYLWKQAIEKLAEQKRAKIAVNFDLSKMPTWQAHFNKVLKFV